MGRTQFHQRRVISMSCTQEDPLWQHSTAHAKLPSTCRAASQLCRGEKLWAHNRGAEHNRRFRQVQVKCWWGTRTSNDHMHLRQHSVMTPEQSQLGMSSPCKQKEARVESPLHLLQLELQFCAGSGSLSFRCALLKNCLAAIKLDKCLQRYMDTHCVKCCKTSLGIHAC